MDGVRGAVTGQGRGGRGQEGGVRTTEVTSFWRNPIRALGYALLLVTGSGEPIKAEWLGGWVLRGLGTG